MLLISGGVGLRRPTSVNLTNPARGPDGITDGQLCSRGASSCVMDSGGQVTPDRGGNCNQDGDVTCGDRYDDPLSSERVIESQ